jgi:signal transduction histidine kinase
VNQVMEYAPLPQAPTAQVPAGLTVEGAARVAWRPNVFGWVALWRTVVVALGVLAIILPVAASPDPRLLAAAALYGALSAVLAAGWSGAARHPATLWADLVICILLIGAATTPASFSLAALYACSAVVPWAARRPGDAFIAGAGGAAACVLFTQFGAVAETAIGNSLVSSASMFGFFALASAGFFTVAHRIGALEIATEISQERGRYRRDLHDRLGQALCGLHFELQAVHAAGPAEGAQARLLSLADGYRDAQSMLADLFRQGDEPMMATDVGAVIAQEARRLAQQSGAVIDVRLSGDASRIPPWIRPHVCAIAGESMTNALKNGEADRIDIDLDIEDTLLIASITDDGVGFDNPPGTLPDKVGHYGLREMAERARICGGDLVVASQPGLGTRIRLTLPLPDAEPDEILERDAGTLRRHVWLLAVVLRSGLGIVAILQCLAALQAGQHRLLLGAMVVLMMLDIGGTMAARRRLLRSFSVRPRLLALPVVTYVTGAALSLWGGVPPWFMLYAPVMMVPVALLGGRAWAIRLTLLWAGSTVALAMAFTATDSLRTTDAQTMLLYLTNIVILGMSAVQGATLLGRLETLQIRVRYQTLARLRQGLSNRMRDELEDRLARLEQTTRLLAADVPDEVVFGQTTRELEAGSSELKAKLREIVHQLADPSPGRTPAHV